MRLSQIFHNTYKESPYKLELESQNLLARAGFMKKADDGGYSFSTLGTVFYQEVQEGLSACFEKKGYGRFYGKSPEGLFQGDVKSFRHLGKGLLGIYNHTEGEVWPKLGMAECRNRTLLISARLWDSLEGAKLELEELMSELTARLGLRTVQLVNVCETAGDEAVFSLYYLQADGLGSGAHLSCSHCGGRFSDRGAAKARPEVQKQEIAPMEEVLTPNIRTIQQLEEFFDLKGDVFLKTIIVEVRGAYFAVLLKGDRELNMHKLSRVLGVNAEDIRLADKMGFSESMGVEAGFIGPVGLKNIKIVADDEVLQATNLICGGNRNDYHLKNVNVGRDYTVHLSGDLKSLEEQDPCPSCSQRALKAVMGFKLATFSATEADGIHTDCPIRYIDREGKEAKAYAVKTLWELNRVMAMLVEEAQVEGGLLFNKNWAPFEYVVTLINPADPVQAEISERLYRLLSGLGHKVLLDDTDERAGVKFSNADLTGAPMRITVGKIAAEGLVELKNRQDNTSEKVEIEALIAKLQSER